MKNILFIERSLDPTLGGVERVTYTLSQGFSEKGYSCFFAFCNEDSKLLSEQKKLKFNFDDSEENLSLVFSEFIKSNDIDILICQNVYFPKFQNVYKRLRKQFNIKIITCFHGNPDIWVNKNNWGCTTNKIYFKELIRSFIFLFYNPFKQRLGGMYELSDKYVLLSESFIPVFKQFYKKEDNQHKLTTIPNPCAFQKTESFLQKEKIVLVVARMAEQQKRISNVIKIWSKVEPVFKDWKLVLVGDGPDLEHYKSMSKKMNLQNIEFVGYTNSVAEYYKISKLFMMTSIWEGFPMTLLEAQHYGCVPIAFNTYAAVKDIITDNSNGFIVERHNTKQFVERMSRLMVDNNLLKSLSAQALQDSKNKFGIEKIIEYWETLFEAL